ncbi:hypothetical protein V496_01054 [Pseudogymnoascus sp. VKM F-4515 (FW-2607)]|nr:hypothetical protein V496_01054 [Pseudogymnoascus sp. VKM F-4515 (FW-2607)]KFY95943.1 hypothetical protein V498_03021 [Pseudogymnoascus sp. VKM F-4517 (FW-2822)]
MESASASAQRQTLTRRRFHLFKKCEQMRRVCGIEVALYTWDAKSEKQVNYHSRRLSIAEKSRLIESDSSVTKYPDYFETDEKSAMKAVPDIKLRDAPPKKRRRKAPPPPPLLPPAVPEDPRLIPLPPSPALMGTQSVESSQPVSLSLSPALMPTQDMGNPQLIPLPPVPLWMIPPGQFDHTRDVSEE